MARATHSTNFSHADDAGFRTWALEFHNLLLAAGWEATTDTGQVDLATAARPAASTYPGYKMYRLNDALKTTAPVLLRVRYGTAGVATYPSAMVQVGIATDGAGNFTGALKTSEVTCYYHVGISSASTPYKSMAGGGEGYGWLLFKRNANSSFGAAFLAVMRSADETGAPTTDGFVMYAGGANVTAHAIAVTAGVVFAPASNQYVMPPAFGYESGAVGTDAEYRTHYGRWMRTTINPFVCTINTVINADTEVTMQVVPGKPMNYICLGTFHNGAGLGVGSTVNDRLMMPWEA